MQKPAGLLLLLVLISFYSFAQTAEVKGRVLNEKKQPIEFASVAILQIKDSSIVSANITDSAGFYSFSNIMNGAYLLAVSSVGTGREYYDLKLTDSTLTAVMVPDIILKQATELKEFEVKAIQPLFIHKPDMLVMNVEGSALRSAGTALDVLKKVPGVIVDNNNNILFRGKSGVNITIDGKSTYLSNDQLAAFLENMSATEIVQIEIITNPSARYDAAGHGGYLNIVTKKKIRQGLNGSAIIWGGYGEKPKAGGGTELTYGSRKWNYYGSFYYGRRDNIEEMDITRKILYADTLSLFDQQSDLNELNTFYNTRGGADYFPDSVTSMGIMAGGRIFDKDYHTNTSTSVTLDPTDSAFSLKQANRLLGRDHRAGSGIYYKKKLDTLGGIFSFNGDVLFYRNGAGQDFETHYFSKQSTETGTPYIQHSTTASDINIYVGKIDYVHPFKKNEAKFEAGAKSSYVTNDNTLLFEVQKNSVWENDTLRSNDFIYKEMINAAYAIGSFKWKKAGFQFGLRTEQTISDGNSPTLNKEVKNEYIQLFPSVFINRPFGKDHNLSASYSRRIDRPSYQDLNPFFYYLDQYTFERGNPFLKPQFTHAFSFQHSFKDAVFTSIDLSRTTDAMTDVTQQIDSTGVTFMDHMNLNTVDNASFSLSFPVPIGKWFMAENSLTEVYGAYRSPLYGTELNNESWSFSANSSLKFTLPEDLTIELSGSYNSRATMGIFNIQEAWQADAGLSKFFFKKSLLLAISFNDIFRSGANTVTVNFQGQDVRMHTYNESRSVYLRLRYTFGKAQQLRKSGYKSAAEDLQNRANKK